MRLTVLGLSALLLADLASAQDPELFTRNKEQIPPRRSDLVSLGTSITTSFLGRARSSEIGWDTARSATGSNSFVTVQAASGGAQTPDQLLAAVGIHNLSIRVGSWPAVGRGSGRGHSFEVARSLGTASVLLARVDSVQRDEYELVKRRPTRAGSPLEQSSIYAGTVGFIRSGSLSRGAVETGVGGDVTLYRFGSRCDPVYGRHPLSIHFFFRIRFGAHGGDQQPPLRHSMSL